MKTRRFFSFFLLLALTAALLAAPAAAADGVGVGGLAPPELRCEAMLLVDADTGKAVFEERGKRPRADVPRQPHQDHDRPAGAGGGGRRPAVPGPARHRTESAMAGLAADGSSAGIQAGETMTVENPALLYAGGLRQRGVQHPGGAGQRQRGRLCGRQERQGRRPGV